MYPRRKPKSTGNGKDDKKSPFQSLAQAAYNKLKAMRASRDLLAQAAAIATSAAAAAVTMAVAVPTANDAKDVANAASEAVKAAQEQLKQLQDQVSEVARQVEQQASDISALRADVTSLGSNTEEAMALAQAVSDDLDDYVAANDTALDLLQKAVDESAARITDLQAKVAAAVTGMNTGDGPTQSDIAALNTEIDDIRAATADVQSRVSGVELSAGSISDLQAAAEAVRAKVETLSSTVTGLQDSVTKLESADLVAEAQAVNRVNETNARLDALKASGVATDADVAAAEADIAQAQADLVTLRGSDVSITDQIAALQAQLATAQSDLATAQTDLATTQAEVAEAKEKAPYSGVIENMPASDGTYDVLPLTSSTSFPWKPNVSGIFDISVITNSVIAGACCVTAFLMVDGNPVLAMTPAGNVFVTMYPRLFVTPATQLSVRIQNDDPSNAMSFFRATITLSPSAYRTPSAS